MSGECAFCSEGHTEASCETASPVEKFFYGCLDWSELSSGAQDDIIQNARLGAAAREYQKRWEENGDEDLNDYAIQMSALIEEYQLT